jgi:hypothetical protein
MRDADLFEARPIAQTLEHPWRRPEDELRHVNHALGAVSETNTQAMT